METRRTRNIGAKTRSFYREDLKKLTSNLPEKYTTFAIDQTRKAVGCELYRAWFPEGERIELPYWKTYECVKLLGAVTKEEELFVTEVADSFKSDVTIQFLKALQTKFGEQLHIILDNATYFTSQKVQQFIEESALKVTYLLTGSPGMNPVEECWRQLKRGLGNRFFRFDRRVATDYLGCDRFGLHSRRTKLFMSVSIDSHLI